MEGERKRRKIKNNQEENEEDEKMKMFFALIHNTKAMRERMIIGSSKQSKEDHKARSGIWNPKFQPQDFIEDDDEDKKLNTAGSSTAQQDNKENKKEDKDKVGGGINELDLNLSL